MYTADIISIRSFSGTNVPTSGVDGLNCCIRAVNYALKAYRYYMGCFRPHSVCGGKAAGARSFRWVVLRQTMESNGRTGPGTCVYTDVTSASNQKERKSVKASGQKSKNDAAAPPL